MKAVCMGQNEQCLPCGADAVMTDTLGNTWCEACAHRGEFLNWGRVHYWPTLVYGPYSLAEGKDMWVLTALLGSDDRVVNLYVNAALVREELAS